LDAGRCVRLDHADDCARNPSNQATISMKSRV
jgi:hypothetical protein